jgi:pimeloyl-ACP methyl ester carboxylesterase
VQLQTPEKFGVDYDKFAVNGADNAKISCWFIPAQESKAVMIVSHGVADGKSGLLHCVLPFIKSGFSIVMYDLRHHGESTGDFCTLGYYETKDLLLITDYVKENLADGKPLCYWGFSLGATVSILAAAKRTDISAVVARSPFENVRSVVKHYAWNFYYMPYFPVVPLALKFFEWKTGAKIDKTDIYKITDKLKNIPILLIGSENDKQVPLEWLENMRDEIGKSAELLVGPYGHVEIFEAMDSDGVDAARAISFLSETITINE